VNSRTRWTKPRIAYHFVVWFAFGFILGWIRGNILTGFLISSAITLIALVLIYLPRKPLRNTDKPSAQLERHPGPSGGEND
jgi:hypothetical protein